jgi:hypothetical protein
VFSLQVLLGQELVESVINLLQWKVLRDNEWAGLIRSIRAAFRKGTIVEYWKTIEPENWFDPEFQDFINNEIL